MVHSWAIPTRVSISTQSCWKVTQDHKDRAWVHPRYPNQIAPHAHMLMCGGGGVHAPGGYFLTFADVGVLVISGQV